MDILLKDVTVSDPSSSFHLQRVSIFIHDGIITEIGTISREAEQTVSMPGLHVSPGFVDPFSHFCDPGLEYRETLETGTLAAANGGYTDVLLVPNTTPVVSQKGGVEYLVKSRTSSPVNLHPLGAITKGAEGKELSEMYDMAQSGAVAFSDGIHPVQSAGILLKALQYVKAIEKVVVQVPDDLSVSANGLMNEGVVSTQLGLPGRPAIAEELMISRDLELAKYTGSKIHFTGVSTAKGVDCIRKAKAQGIHVTCSVTPAHLYFCDEDLAGYDTNLKVSPPLRTRDDREALRQAVLDGTVDCIAAHHFPHHTDHKVVEFEYAKNGMIALETALGVVKTSLPSLPAERLTEIFSLAPRRIFGLPSATISLHATATLSLFLPDEPWRPERFVSRSRNSPFVGKQLTGKAVGIINGDKVFLGSL